MRWSKRCVKSYFLHFWQCYYQCTRVSWWFMTLHWSYLAIAAACLTTVLVHPTCQPWGVTVLFRGLWEACFWPENPQTGKVETMDYIAEVKSFPFMFLTVTRDVVNAEIFFSSILPSPIHFLIAFWHEDKGEGYWWPRYRYIVRPSFPHSV